LALGELDLETFRANSQLEQGNRHAAKLAAEQVEAEQQRRKDEVTDQKNRVLFAKREEQIKRRHFLRQFGQDYIEKAHHGRVMRILRSVADGNPIDSDDILWLGSTGSDYWTDALRKAHHSNQAKVFTEAWKRTGDDWQAINACAQWRKADLAETGLAIVEEALGHTPDRKLRSAALTTRGGALRDLRRHKEAMWSAGEAHDLTPTDFRPCTLLGAIHMEMGDYPTGADWYAKAEARGATKELVDRELRSILSAATPRERDGIKAALIARDPNRYSWL
jgi:hypothetical protein